MPTIINADFSIDKVTKDKSNLVTEMRDRAKNFVTTNFSHQDDAGPDGQRRRAKIDPRENFEIDIKKNKNHIKTLF